MRACGSAVCGWLVRLAFVAALSAVHACSEAPDGPEFECDRSMTWPEVASPVSVPDGMGGTVRIDATEVTRAQYQRFLEATAGGTDVMGQPSYCHWNDSFVPNDTCLADDVDPGLACANLPVVCIDWCDAHMYCQWAGKRLCGGIAGGGTAIRPEDYYRPSAGEWATVCSAGDRYEYGFGDEAYGHECNSPWCTDTGGCPFIAPVGSFPNCQSPEREYAGVFDLSGGECQGSCRAFRHAAAA